VRSVIQWSNLRHLGESLGGAEGLLEAVSFNKATKGIQFITIPEMHHNNVSE